MNIQTDILHCNDDGSDKVYIVEVNEIKNNYTVTTIHGPRLAAVLNQRIIYDGANKYTAMETARKAVRKKQREYSIAPANLVIKGYNKTSNKLLSIVADNKVPKAAEQQLPTGRKISL